MRRHEQGESREERPSGRREMISNDVDYSAKAATSVRDTTLCEFRESCIHLSLSCEAFLPVELSSPRCALGLAIVELLKETSVDLQRGEDQFHFALPASRSTHLADEVRSRLALP